MRRVPVLVLLLALLLAPAAGAQEPVPGTATGPLRAEVDALGFAGGELHVVVDDAAIVALAPDGRRREVVRADLARDFAVGDGIAAVVGEDGRFDVLGLDGTGRRTVVACRPDALLGRPAPVASAGRVAWPACDGRSLLVADHAGQRVVPAGGEVLAVGLGGSGLAWVVRGARALELRTLDLVTGAAAGPVAVDEALDPVDLDVAPDGRLRLAAADAERCAEVRGTVTAPAAPVPVEALRCSGRFAFTDAGGVLSVLAGLRPGLGSRLLLVDDAGREVRRLGTLGGSARFAELAAAGDRYAITTLGCRGSVLRAGTVGAPPFARPRCPVMLRRRAVRVRRDGRLALPVRCAAGCFGAAGQQDLRIDGRIAATADSLLDARSGRAASVAFRLDRRARSALRRRGRLAAVADLVGYDGVRHRLRMTLVAAR